ncbi:helix-turn-helix domain-containing protein [Anaerotignum sp.]
MDIPTRNLGRYVKEKGVNITRMSEETGIAYTVLYDSLLHKNRDRDLRIGEYFAICKFLEKNPMDFMEEEKDAS